MLYWANTNYKAECKVQLADALDIDDICMNKYNI